MLVLSYCSILFFVLPHFFYTQARKWNVEICYTEAHKSSVHLILNGDTYTNITCPNEDNCFTTEIDLVNDTRPHSIDIRPSTEFQIVIENKDLEEAYGVLCEAPCPGAKMTLSNWTHWTFEVQRNNAYGKYEFYIRLDPYVKQKVVFQPNSTTANKSFLLPTEMNTLSEIKLLTRGKFQLGTDIKVKNMDTSEIYSCIYLLDQLSQVPYHECKSINDSMWRVELTSRSRLIRDRVVLTVLLVVHGSGIHSLHQLRLKKLAYIPTFAEFAIIGNLRMNEVLVYFNYPHEAFDIFQIVITNALTGKVYGCKIWQLIIMSSEELEQAFFVEIIQGTLSSFSKGLVWQNLCEHGYGCVDHFYLETYEDNEITGLKLHFLDKPIRINDDVI
ncbi:uncharacterized protein LOC118764737 [Octopus sinensis]|uniref:Uncharacterized protein LOC118764737 n=1 Tax=Octopus sinensis TaxID=2607531 RepID=A0A7E6F3S3_9MOLL|nr:uncharacterized protein LOC118764737 [Octopus sinensis]